MVDRPSVWLAACGLLAGLSPSRAAELTVPGDFDTIQAAIDAAVDGDVVLVEPATYVENLTLKTGVDVRGREAARTLLQAADTGQPAVLVSDADDLVFGNFTLAAPDVGVDVIDSTGVQIVSTIIDGATTAGLRVDALSQVDALNNVFRENAVAVNRATVDAQLTNTAFVSNTTTITSPLISLLDPNDNVDNCGFFDNSDLDTGGVDTGLGDNPVIGDPLFVDVAAGDFHLAEGSPFIDTGVGTDAVDNTTADIGAFGGQFADVSPFPLPLPEATDTSAIAPPPYSAEVTWTENLDYRVTNSSNPGSYRLYYRQNASGPPYDGTDAGNGTLPSPVEAGTATSLSLQELQPVAPVPGTPQLISANALNEAVALSWTVVDDATGYRVSWGIDTVDENTAEAGNTTSLTVGGLSNGETYLFAVRALREPVYYFSVTSLDNTQNRNESDFSPEAAISLGPSTAGSLSNTLSATPSLTVPFPNLPDNGGCFVATAAFGADWEAEVLVLRDFRDRHLQASAVGRAFVRWYYRSAPAAANWIGEREWARTASRWALYPFVLASLVIMDVGAVELGLLLLLTPLLIGTRRRRRAAVTLRPEP